MTSSRFFTLTDPFCAGRLDAEYGALIRRLIAKLARKRPSPFERGDLRIWAAASNYAVGSVNFLFDRPRIRHRGRAMAGHGEPERRRAPIRASGNPMQCRLDVRDARRPR
jgi:hypothetical protein